MVYEDRRFKLTSNEVRLQLWSLRVVRITPSAIEMLGIVPLGTGETWVESLLKSRFLRHLPADEAAMTNFCDSYDVVQEDGDVVAQAENLKVYRKGKKLSSLSDSNVDEAGDLVRQNPQIGTKADKAVQTSKEMSPAVRQLLPGLALSLRSEFGLGIYAGFPGIKFVGDKRCRNLEAASSTLEELLDFGFVVRIDETRIKFTEKAKVVIERREIDPSMDLMGGHQPAGGEKQKFKHLRRDVRAVVAELGELDLVLGDPRLDEIIKRLSLERLKQAKDLFIACEELARGNYLVVPVKKEGEVHTYHVMPDDELRRALQNKSTGGMVVQKAPQVAVAKEIKNPKIKESRPMVETQDSQVVVKPPVETVAEPLDTKWIDFLFLRLSDNWSMGRLLGLCTKWKVFIPVDLREALVGRVNMNGTMLARGNANSAIHNEKAAGRLLLNPGSSLMDGSGVSWDIKKSSFNAHELTRLLAEYEASSKTLSTQTISGPVVVQEVPVVPVAEVVVVDGFEVVEMDATANLSSAERSVVLDLDEGVRNLQKQIAGLFQEQTQQFERQLGQEKTRHEEEEARLQSELATANTKLKAALTEIVRLHVVLSQLASAIEAAKS